MALAIVLGFDATAEQAVVEVWKAIRAVSGSGRLFDLRGRPHVSLAVYPEGARGPLEKAVAAFRPAPLPFVLASAAAFPGDEGAVFLAPVVDEALLRLHREWHALAPGAHEYYRPGAWVPHCTVGFNLPEGAVPYAVAAARALLPIRGRYESIGLIESDRDGKAPIRHLLEQPLG
ncbi:MAG TPA: 2'-5' RNA ligase family protein [Candidatus Limnocylindrales bacterium]